MGSKQKIAFVTYTPYHIFLSLMMAFENQKKGIDQQLVIFSNFIDAQVLYDALNNCKGSPFSKITLFRGEYGVDQASLFKRAYLRYFAEMNMCRDFLRFVKREGFQRIFMFNEDRPSSLYLLEYIKKVKDKVAISFVEDGAVSYNSFVAFKPSNYIFLGKIFYGSWWRNIQIMGLSELFDSVWALFPELIRDELKVKKVEKISSGELGLIKEFGIADKILKNYGMNPQDVGNFNCIVLLSHSSVISKYPEYKSTLLNAVKKAQDKGYSVAVKYHPRDMGDFLGLKKEPKITCLRSSVPLEFIFLQARDSLSLVVADMSTVPLSARLILPNAKVISTGILIGSKDDRFLNVLNSLGVKLPKTFEEFNSYLS